MRNKYEGTCYKCGQIVKVGEGHFERHYGKWRVQHFGCVGKEPSFSPAFESDKSAAQ
jgi:hypothetical protein